MLRIGVVGYGTGGQHFHTPFIAAARGCALAGIVARAPDSDERFRSAERTRQFLDDLEAAEQDRPQTLDPRTLRGRWLTAAFQHNRLHEAGSEADRTVVYLISDRPFAASLR